MNKKLVLIVGFLSYMVAGLFVTQFLVQWKVDQEIPFHSGDVLNNIGIAIYYATLGYIIYFLIINATAIAGWLISKRRRDTEAAGVCKAATVFTLVSTLVFFLYYFN